MKAGSNVTCVWIFRAGQGSCWVGRLLVLGERPLVSLNADPLISLSLCLNKLFRSPRKICSSSSGAQTRRWSGKFGRCQGEAAGGQHRGKIFPGKKKRKKEYKTASNYFHSAQMWLPSNNEHWQSARWSERVIEGSLCDC